MADRHKRHPRALRLPEGLEAWITDYAHKTGQSVNAVIVAACETFRREHTPKRSDRSYPPVDNPD